MKLPTLNHVRNMVAKLDAERPDGRDALMEMPPDERNFVARHNLFHATLETLNAIPGVSLVSGICTVAMGLAECLEGFGNYLRLDDPDAAAHARAGLKLMLLGGAAAVFPGVGNILNGVAAAGDVVDTLNSATRP